MMRSRLTPWPRLATGQILLALLTCMSGWAHALTLGQFSVESALGQPLRAAVEITQYTVEDLQKLTVKLAEPASFEQAGMRFHPALTGLQTRLEFRGDGKPYMALIGQTPVSEHFIDVIVEAQWPSGRLAMNYTLLVSPVGAPPALGAAANKDSPAAPPLTPVISPVVSPLTAGLATLAPPLPLREDAITARAGDTAIRLLGGHWPAGISLDQMLMAMVRANPEAFIEGNVNLLREGARVQLPTAQEAAQTSAEQARKTVIAQTVDFAAYAQRLAQSSLMATETVKQPLPDPTGPATLPVQVAITAAGPAAKDQLTLSPPDSTAGRDEARLAVEREIQDKTEQLAALKKNLETLKSLLAEPDLAASKPSGSPVLSPDLPKALAAQAPPTFLDLVSRHPSLWAWVLALLSGMGAVVWVVRSRSSPADNLFEVEKATPSASRATATTPATYPLASGLPPQFAGLDLNLGPVNDASQDSTDAKSPRSRA